MFIESGGYLLSTVEMGTGSRTLVSHGGWMGSWELWQEPMQMLQSSWRCISYDHRGTGASTAPAEAIDPRALVADLFTVLDRFGVQRCVLAGESMGAATCVMAALAQPDRFDGLVIVDGLVITPDFGQQTQIRADYPAYVAQFVDACIPEPDCEHIKAWGRKILLRAEPEAAARMSETHSGLNPDLGSVVVPTLVIHGELDAIVPLGVGRETAAAIPDAELVVLPGAGHVPTITRPAEVVRAIDEWTSRRLP